MADLDVTIRLSRPIPAGIVVPPMALPPADLINLVLIPQDWASVFLTFDDPGKSATSYELQYSTSPVFAPGTVTTQILPPLPMATSAHFIFGLNLTFPVYIRIRAVNSIGNSNYTIGIAQAPVPAQLLNFNGAALSTTSVNLGWTDPGNWAITYDFEYAVITIFIPGPFTTVSLPASPGIGSQTVTGLLPSTQYLFRIRAINPVGASAYAIRKISTP